MAVRNYTPTQQVLGHKAGYSVLSLGYLLDLLDEFFATAGGGVPSTRTISAGTGLSGGGDLSADRTIALSAGSQTNLALASTAVQPARTITAGTGLTGGGTLAADRTLAVAYGSSAGTAAQGNDSRITGAVQSTRQVTAGTGLSGGGDLSADRSFAVSYGTAANTATQGNDVRLPLFRSWLSSAFVTTSTTAVDVNTWNGGVTNFALASGVTYLVEILGSTSSGSSAAVTWNFVYSGTTSLIQAQVASASASSAYSTTESQTGALTFTKNSTAGPVSSSCVITTTSAGNLKLQAAIASGTLTIRAGTWIRITQLS